jgi:ribosomal protein S12 methylthiotransferase
MRKIKGQNKINVITLGCAKNIVDSEQLLKQLEINGLQVEHDASQTDARNIIINTCGFINDAKQESIDTILAWADLRQAGKIDHLFVMGCLSERYKNELIKEIPEVDAFFGVNSIEQVVEKLGFNLRTDLLGDRILSTPKHYAYLKISEGCNRRCSFCAIPLIRGKHISRPIEDILAEAKLLCSRGTKELILVAQDLTYYGLDIYKKHMLPELLDRLATESGAEWIRLHYAYPAEFPVEVLDVMKRHSNICHYLDIPFQHISDNMLKTMRRGNNRQQTYELMDKIRTAIPDIALRTTLLTGHPGETEADFNELLQFVKEARFDRLGVFAYSHEEDTHSYTLTDDLSDEEKQSRVDKLMEVQQLISEEKNNARIGKTYKILIDRQEGDYWVGRTEYDSPEIDNEVLVSTSGLELKVGEFIQARVTSASDYDLFADYIA